MSRRGRFDDRRDRTHRGAHRPSDRELYDFYMRKKEERHRLDGDEPRRHSSRRSPVSQSFAKSTSQFAGRHRPAPIRHREREATGEGHVPVKQRRKDTHVEKSRAPEKEKSRSPRDRTARKRSSPDKEEKIASKVAKSSEEENVQPTSSSSFALEEYPEDVFADDLGLEEDNVNVEAMCEAAMLTADEDQILDKLLECAEAIEVVDEDEDIDEDETSDSPQGSDDAAQRATDTSSPEADEHGLASSAAPSCSGKSLTSRGVTVAPSESNGIAEKKSSVLPRDKNAKAEKTTAVARSVDNGEREDAPKRVMKREEPRKAVASCSDEGSRAERKPTHERTSSKPAQSASSRTPKKSRPAESAEEARSASKRNEQRTAATTSKPAKTPSKSTKEGNGDAGDKHTSAKNARKRITFDLQEGSEKGRSRRSPPPSNSSSERPSSKQDVVTVRHDKKAEEVGAVKQSSSRPEKITLAAVDNGHEPVVAKKQSSRRPEKTPSIAHEYGAEPEEDRNGDLPNFERPQRRTDAYGPAMAFLAGNRRGRFNQRGARDGKRRHDKWNRGDRRRETENGGRIRREMPEGSYYDLPVSANVLHSRDGRHSSSSRRGSSSRIILR